MTSRQSHPGRPSVPERSHFKALEEVGPAKGGHMYHVCKHCIEAHRAGTKANPPTAIQGRSRNYRRHLKSCKHYQDAQAIIGLTSPSVAVGSKCSRLQSSCIENGPPSPKKVARSLELPGIVIGPIACPKPTPRQVTAEEKWTIERALVELHDNNHLACQFIEQNSTRYFLELLCPGITSILPSRRVLGRAAYADRCYKKDSKTLREKQDMGGRVNLVSDVWQNVRKEHVLGVKLILFGATLTYSIPNAGSKHDGIVIANQFEDVLKNAQGEGWNVGAIITDDVGQCRRARQILTLRWPKLPSCSASPMISTT